jgi:arylsulfatase A-like enzyme
MAMPWAYCDGAGRGKKGPMSRRARRLALAVLLAVALGAAVRLLRRPGGAILDGRAVCPGCNVLLVSIDTLRADHLGLYGYARPTSPAIDRLGATAVVFDDATAAAPWTLSSHMSLFTGLYPAHHGVRDRGDRLSDAVPTLADLLRAGGYRTAAFTGGGYVSRAFNYHGFGVFDDTGDADGRNFPAVVRWLADHAGERFFLFWHDYTAHCPYDPPPAHDLFSDPGYAGIVRVAPDPEEPLCAHDPRPTCRQKCLGYYTALLDRMTAADLAQVTAKYDGDVHRADERVGALLDLLDRSGAAGRTVVVLLSDHGESLADRPRRRRIGHHLMYQEVLRVPLVLRVPGLPGGRRVAEPVELIDVMPTLLAIVGVASPAGLDGRSLLAPHPARPVLSEHFADGLEEYAWREGRRKLLLLDHAASPELYDLAADPGERRDLHDPADASEAAMRKRLAAAVGGARRAAEPATIDPANRDRLRALGYVK